MTDLKTISLAVIAAYLILMILVYLFSGLQKNIRETIAAIQETRDNLDRLAESHNLLVQEHNALADTHNKLVENVEKFNNELIKRLENGK